MELVIMFLKLSVLSPNTTVWKLIPRLNLCLRFLCRLVIVLVHILVYLLTYAMVQDII
jgi:hypothetical protein